MSNIPPPPPGFVLENDPNRGSPPPVGYVRADDIPPPPPGFVMMPNQQPKQQDGGWSADNVMRTLSRGALGIGSYLDEADAAFNATLAPVVDPLLPDSFQKLPQENWSDRYNAALDIQRGKDRAFDEAHPYSSTALQIAGGVGSGAALLAGAPVVGNTILGNGGRTVGQRVLNTAGTGLATGAVQGFGAGEGDIGDRSWQATKEGGIGTVTGPLLMPVASGIGAGVNFVRSRLGNSGNPIGVATGRLLSDDLAAEGTDLATLAARAKELGPDAMLADTSDILRLRTEQLAQTDNPSRSLVMQALKDRNKGAPTRIRGLYDDALGDRPNVYQTLTDLNSQRSEAARPLYAKAESHPVAWDDRLQQFLDEPTLKSGLAKGYEVQRLEALADGVPFKPEDYAITGFNDAGDPIISGVPNFKTLDMAKKGLDALVDENRDEFGRLTQKGVALDKVRDSYLSKLDSINPFYADARKAWAGPTRAKAAFERGRNIFGNKEHPDFLEADLKKMAADERDAYTLGTRVAADQSMGQVRNGALKGRQLLDSDFNERKILSVLGEDEGRRLIGALQGEQAMAETSNQALGNSATARRIMGNPFATSGPNLNDVPTSFFEAGRRMVQKEIDGATASSRERIAKELGPFLTATGSQRDTAIRRVAEALAGQQRIRTSDPKIEAIARALTQSAGRAASPLLPWIR